MSKKKSRHNKKGRQNQGNNRNTKSNIKSTSINHTANQSVNVSELSRSKKKTQNQPKQQTAKRESIFKTIMNSLFKKKEQSTPLSKVVDTQAIDVSQLSRRKKALEEKKLHKPLFGKKETIFKEAEKPTEPVKEEVPVAEEVAATSEVLPSLTIPKQSGKKESKTAEGVSKKPAGRGRKIAKRILLTLLILILAGAGFAAFEYYRLQPDKHFSQVPVVGGNKAEQSNGTFNVLLLGSDARPEDTVSHTDSIVVIHVDLNKKEYSMISIPRDTRVYLDGYGYTKLTSAQYVVQSNKGTQAGIEEAVKQVSKLTGLTINYYAEAEYRGFRNMVDAIGGINMNIPFKVTLGHPWNPKNYNKVIEPGTHFFNGEMVSEITHERYSLPGTDYGRQQLQKEALIGIAKAVENPNNIGKLPDLIKSIPKFLIATNLSTEDMLSFALAAKGFEANQLQYYQVTGEGKEMFDDVLQANNSQIIINQQELDKIIETYFKN